MKDNTLVRLIVFSVLLSILLTFLGAGFSLAMIVVVIRPRLMPEDVLMLMSAGGIAMLIMIPVIFFITYLETRNS